MIGHLARHPSACLLLSQLGAVLLYPFFDRGEVGFLVLALISMAIVAAALWAVRNTPALWVVAGCLGLPAMAMSVAEALWPEATTVALISACLHAPFYFYVSYAQIRYLFDDNTVTTDELWAAGAAFTVVAWGFAYLFVAIQELRPDAFAGANAGQQSFFELLFLSFTTLTSVGLSDVIPLDLHARSVVMIEEVVGVMYVGLVVARLVGLTIQRAASRS